MKNSQTEETMSIVYVGECFHGDNADFKPRETPNMLSEIGNSQPQHDHPSEFDEPLSPTQSSFSSDSKRQRLSSAGTNITMPPDDCALKISGTEPEDKWSSFRSKVVELPYDYVSSLPTKGIRDKFLDALNIWLESPEDHVALIKDVINVLHNSSLIIDDFQDDSPLRRGRPSTHTIFGAAQSINSATHGIIKAISMVQSFSDAECAAKTTEMILVLFQGQATDLHWTFNSICPSLEEYIQMINDKTGALFRLACFLLAESSGVALSEELTESISKMVTLWGQYFQIRDDYMNLVDADYTDQKGFCEDLDEGKYSLPLIHAIQTDTEGFLLANLLSTRRAQGKLTPQQKMLVLDRIKASGGFEVTRSILSDLHVQVMTEIEGLECGFNKQNGQIRALAERLRL
ncbi:hypothetical protein AK830_g4208 [Neonectria ditissima]|uniref:Uncharacterized protein n=1 Tax=Neonectria ditissima TaxID=78410 RepID=A0A0P7BNI7_9HYPO|nr:hypothetical protein AK830_g4208 [Neonectria ditissima]